MYPLIHKFGQELNINFCVFEIWLHEKNCTSVLKVIDMKC